MFSRKINHRTELKLIESSHTSEFFAVLDLNRDHLRRWHPWVDLLRSPNDVSKAIALWRHQHAGNRGFHAGIWFDGRFCGVINHINADFTNLWTTLSYWLDAGHQGRGIMTASCRAVIEHAFETWKLNRVTIECATENTRSRRIPERLGFKLEGVIRQVEWLNDHLADHALYGLLRADYDRAKLIHDAHPEILADRQIPSAVLAGDCPLIFS